MAPSRGTIVAIYGQPGETVSRAGLSSSAVRAQASPGPQPRFSLVPSGPMAALRATGLALPVIALLTGGGWQVSLLIPQADPDLVRSLEQGRAPDAGRRSPLGTLCADLLAGLDDAARGAA